MVVCVILLRVFTKCKVLAAVKGPDYMEDEVSNEETLHKIGQLQYELAKAYDYAQGWSACCGMKLVGRFYTCT